MRKQRSLTGISGGRPQSATWPLRWRSAGTAGPARVSSIGRTSRCRCNGAGGPAARCVRHRACRGGRRAYRRWSPPASPSRSGGCPWCRDPVRIRCQAPCGDQPGGPAAVRVRPEPSGKGVVGADGHHVAHAQALADARRSVTPAIHFIAGHEGGADPALARSLAAAPRPAVAWWRTSPPRGRRPAPGARHRPRVPRAGTAPGRSARGPRRWRRSR